MLLIFALGASSFFFAPISASPIQSPKLPVSTIPQSFDKDLSAVLPPLEKSQADVLAYLEEKNGGELTLPSYPTDSLLQWTQQNFEAAGRDAKMLYAAVYGQLLAIQPLLAHENPQQRRRGLRVAHNANLKVATRLKDKRLTALIFDGFVLPYLDVASAGVNDTLSRQRLLQDASSAYRLSGETEKRIAVLRVLVGVAEAEQNPNQADWARVKLAEGLAAQGQYQEAIIHLQAVKASNLSGSKSWIPELEKKLREQQQNAAPKQDTKTKE